MPWHTTGRYANSPINITSRKAYRGINTISGAARNALLGVSSGVPIAGRRRRDRQCHATRRDVSNLLRWRS
jgi:hypothetical protein